MTHSQRMSARDPRALREQAVRELMAATRSHVGVFHGLVRRADTRTLHVASIVVEGHEGVASIFRRNDGIDYGALGIEVDHAAPFGQFMVHLLENTPTEVQRQYWSKLGITSSISTNLESHGRFLGTFAGYRVGGAPYTARELTLADRLVPLLTEAAERADRLEASSSTATGPWVLDARGAVQFGPPPEADHPPGPPPSVCLAAQGFLQGGLANAVTARSYYAFQRLVGRNTSVVLVTCHPVEPFVVHEALRLTTLRRRVAGLAARGASVPEIAAVLDRSPETVRTHLKNVYARLGVGTRLELLEAIRNVWR